MHFQHPDGGFGGGPGQLAHLLPTYASIMTLAMVGSPAAWAQIDRKKCYDFFMRCKRPDGSFVVCKGGEVDVRGIYCMLVVATILDILTPELVRGTEAYVSACQTFEGGFAAASLPSFSSTSPSSFQQPNVSPASAEAHGGYASCALFSLFLLRSASATCAASDSPRAVRNADPEACLRWAVQMQGESIEAGGFRGRANKLVDGCYGWWVGGLFAVLEAMIKPDTVHDTKHSTEDHEDDEWVDEPSGALYPMLSHPKLILSAQSLYNRGTFLARHIVGN
jgi:protein farnesyltransferase subunit beta